MGSRNLAKVSFSFLTQVQNQALGPSRPSSCLVGPWKTVEVLGADQQVRWTSGETPGGTKGGAGGTIRQGGGSLGQFGAAQEDGYFYNKAHEQLKKMKAKMDKEAKKETDTSQKEEKP